MGRGHSDRDVVLMVVQKRSTEALSLAMDMPTPTIDTFTAVGRCGEFVRSHLGRLQSPQNLFIGYGTRLSAPQGALL